MRDVDHLVVLEVRDGEVGGGVIDFHPRDGFAVEAGQDDVGGEDAETAGGMQFPVHGGGEHTVRLEREFPQFSVLVQDAAALGAADVEQGIVPARLSMDMAVHAGVLRVLIVADRRLVEILNAAFHDGDFMVHLVGRLDEPVGEPAVDGILAHVHGPAVRDRFSVHDGLRRHGDGLSLGTIDKSLPFPEVPFHRGALDGDGLVAEGEGRFCVPDAVHRVPEIERRNVGRNGNVLIIRINHKGAFAAVHGRGGIPSSASRQGQERQKQQV